MTDHTYDYWNCAVYMFYKLKACLFLFDSEELGNRPFAAKGHVTYPPLNLIPYTL